MNASKRKAKQPVRTANILRTGNSRIVCRQFKKKKTSSFCFSSFLAALHLAIIMSSSIQNLVNCDRIRHAVPDRKRKSTKKAVRMNWIVCTLYLNNAGRGPLIARVNQQILISNWIRNPSIRVDGMWWLLAAHVRRRHLRANHPNAVTSLNWVVFFLFVAVARSGIRMRIFVHFGEKREAK